MTMQEGDLLTRLHAADMTVDDLARKATKIHEDVARLSESQRTQMPVFRGPWTKEAIQVHLERVQEWARTPIRAANRLRLEALGIRGASIKPDILDDSEILDQVLREVEVILAACPFVKPCLIKDTCLPAWLSQGVTATRQKLSAMKKGIEGYKRLHAFQLLPSHLDELLRNAVANPDTLTACEATARQLELLQHYNIGVPASDAVSTIEAPMGMLTNNLTTLQSRFPERLEALRPSIHAQSMTDAQTVVAEEVARCEKEYDSLLSEWQKLERTLCLLGIGHLDAAEPRTLSGLREQIADFRKRCSAKVGEEGMSLLAFLQGHIDFPASLTLEAVRDALLSLRPLIVISSKAGDQDA